MDNSEHKSKNDQSVKDDMIYQAVVDKHLDSLVCIRDALKIEDYSTAKEAWLELDQETQIKLWKAPKHGGWFTTAERTQMKSNEWSAAQ
jgi:hypothetical protein